MLQRSELELGHSLDVAVLTQFANALLLSTSAGESKRLIDPMLKQLCQIAAVELHPESFLDTEASHTPFGKAVSLTTAAQCAEDPERGRVFIQGIYQAIQDRLKAHPGQIVNILYAGTGPFAWLLIPLLPLFSASQIQVTLLDIHQASLDKVATDFGAIVVAPQEIYAQDVDVYAPCALGATLNTNTINRLKCKVVAGAANNQLADEVKHGNMLIEKGITLAPDFLINAGGVINVGAEYFGDYHKELVFAQTEKIYDTCLSILDKSQQENIPAQQAAIEAAKARIEAIGRVKLSF